MAKKYYAVKKGRIPGIYLNWADCKKNIDGFSGAVYKGFETIQEAEAFVSGGVKSQGAENLVGGTKTQGAENFVGGTKSQGAENFVGGTKSQGVENLVGSAKMLEAPETVTGDRAIAYVDGSYNVATKEYSYGAVIFYEGKEEHFSEKFSNPKRAVMRNVAGEIEGSMCAMKYCLEHGIGSLDIYFDYEGIEKWCNGDWKATKEGTIAYRDFYREASKKVVIRFVKVKGHSGDKYNDLADELAKEAVGLA